MPTARRSVPCLVPLMAALTALLCAVKPYLSPQRREAAETVIRICRIWDALERSGISLTGLLGGGGAVPAATAKAEEVVT